MGFMEVLRRATEEDVDRALEDAPFDLPPQDEAQLLDFFNRMLDLMVTDGLGADE